MNRHTFLSMEACRCLGAEAISSKQHCSKTACVCEHTNVSNIHTTWLQRKPKTQEHRNTAICFFPLLSPPHKYTLIATVFRVSLGLAKWEPVFPRELCQSHTWSLFLEEWNPLLSYSYFLAKERTAPLCSRALGFQRVRLLLDSWPPGNKGGSLWVRPEHTQARQGTPSPAPLGAPREEKGQPSRSPLKCRYASTWARVKIIFGFCSHV